MQEITTIRVSRSAAEYLRELRRTRRLESIAAALDSLIHAQGRRHETALDRVLPADREPAA